MTTITNAPATPQEYFGAAVAPLVLTFSFPRRDDSPRWKQVVEIGPNRFTHHLEIYHVAEVDDQVYVWLREAWASAG